VNAPGVFKGEGGRYGERYGKYADADWRKNAEIEDALHWMLA